MDADGDARDHHQLTTTAPDPALVEELVFRGQLRFLFRRALTLLDAAAADHGLSPLGYHAVLVLGGAGAEGVIERELVEQLASSRAHVSVVTRSLAEAGLVTRHRGAPDRRRVRLQLTDRGWEVVRGIAELHQTRLRALVADWDPARLERLLERIMAVYLGLPGHVRVETDPGQGGPVVALRLPGPTPG